MRVRRLFTLLVAVAIAIAIGFAWSPSPAQAEEVDVGVTQAMEEIINAFDTAAVESRFPENRGEVVSRWTNLAGGDTGWAAPTSLVEENVDTGWDMSDITDADSMSIHGGDQAEFWGETVTLTPSDTVVRAVQVANMGNNYVEIDFSVLHEAVESDSFNLSLYYEDGFHKADDFDPETIGQEVIAPGIEGGAGDIEGWTMGQVRTIFLVVEAHTDAADGSEVKSDFEITNNAPVSGDNPSTTGDGWERGTPTDEDQYDTQFGVFWTEVAGPDITIEKDQEIPSGQTRPGDTINYTLTLENTGGDTASDVVIVDAIPEFTSYVEGSYSDTATIYDVSPTVEFSDSLATFDWQSEGTHDAEDVQAIRWTYDAIPADQEEAGEGSLDMSFSVTID